MAAAGISLTNFHTAAAICTPSRAGILTGLFPWRLGIHTIFGGSGDLRDCYLPRSMFTIPALFEAAGYHTAHVGKNFCFLW